MHDLAEPVIELEPSVLIHDLRNDVENPSVRDAALLEFEDVGEPEIHEMYRDWRRDRQGVERETDDRAVQLLQTALTPEPDPFGTEALGEEFKDAMKRLHAGTAAPKP